MPGDSRLQVTIDYSVAVKRVHRCCVSLELAAIQICTAVHKTNLRQSSLESNLKKLAFTLNCMLHKVEAQMQPNKHVCMHACMFACSKQTCFHASILMFIALILAI